MQKLSGKSDTYFVLCSTAQMLADLLLGSQQLGPYCQHTLPQAPVGMPLGSFLCIDGM